MKIASPTWSAPTGRPCRRDWPASSPRPPPPWCPCAWRAASGWSAIGINRREVTPDGRVILGRNHFGRFDPEVGVVRVERADGTPLAAMVNYACHAVCLMADNYLLSADYPGYAMHALEERLPGAMGLFFQGACGNVNPREAAVNHGFASGGSFSIAARTRDAALAREARAGLGEGRALRGRLPSASPTAASPSPPTAPRALKRGGGGAGERRARARASRFGPGTPT